MQQEFVNQTEGKDTLNTSLPEDYQLNLSDFALFMSVMKVKRAYENVLGIILDESDLRLKEVKAEQVILNKSGKRAIRLDAWAMDERGRQYDMEMQNDSNSDDIRRRSRYYQGLMDTPILKAGKETRYKYLPSTTIIFITQDDIFGKDLAKYTFSEWCEEVPDLPLGDGTSKIFLNMSSFNGRKELVSLLQYMKNTTLDNPDIIVKDARIEELDEIVREVKESEEWEAVRMNIMEIAMERGMQYGIEQGIEQGIEKGIEKGIEQGIEKGIEQGMAKNLIKNVDSVVKNFGVSLQRACEGLGISLEEYETVRKKVALMEKKE